MNLPAENIHELPQKRIMDKIGSLYRAGRIWTYGEQSLLLDLLRTHSEMEAEADEIKAYHSQLGSKRMFFPQSVFSLLSNWDSMLDKVAYSKQKRIHGPVKDPVEAELRQIQADMTALKYSHWDLNKAWDHPTSKEKYDRLLVRKRALIK